MRLRTVIILGGLFVFLGALVVFGIGVSPSGGELTERWVSDTPRENERNHHAVGVGPKDNIIVAPVSEVPNSDVMMTDTSCSLVRLSPEDGSVMWQVGMPAEECFSHALTEPAIEDIDGDGTPEVIVSTTENALIAYTAQNGTEKWRVPLTTYGYGRPTVANITPAPGPEIVTSDINGGVVVANGDGSVAWRFALNDTSWQNPTVWQAPVVDDFDRDGQPEVLIGSDSGPVVLTANGEIKWIRDGSARYITTAQADDDPAIEVFTAGTSAVRAYDGESGDLEWKRDLATERIHTAADGDGDGTVELYVGRIGGEILSLDAHSGETEWSTTVSSSNDDRVPPPVLGDVDGDDTPEVIAVSNSGTVAVLDPESGDELAAYERTVPIWTFATLADIDDDGHLEILVRYGDGRVVALDYTS